jgi:hypothetical protein
MNFQKYLNVVSGSFRKAVKVEWLNPDESVAFEFTNSLYDINVDLSVNYQNGSRRTCTLTLNNDKNKFPINFNNIWFGQKFKLWMGTYIDDKTPYYFPQGVFYISNPDEVYQPNSRTIKINGVDKWAFLDGTLHGKLIGTYQTGIGTNLFDATKSLLLQSVGGNDVRDYFNIKNKNDYWFSYDGTEFKANNAGFSSTTAKTELVAMCDLHIKFEYSFNTTKSRDVFSLWVNENGICASISGTNSGTFEGDVLKGKSIVFEYKKKDYGHPQGEHVTISNFEITSEIKTNVVDPIPPFLAPYFVGKKHTIPIWDEATNKYVDKTVEVLKCPYTAKVEKGKTYADVLLEYATILCAHIYYDANGRLVIEPMIDTADDITDTNKEVVWNFTVEEKQLLGLNQTYNFDKVYNDIIVLGNIANGYQFKARVQNRNIMSDTCIQKIGLKSKEPFEDNQYYSDDQCKELAMYYAKIDTILQKTGDISSTPLYHLDVNKLVTVSTPNNNMSKELFLITGYTLNSSDSMSVKVTSVNELKNFSVAEGSFYGG